MRMVAYGLAMMVGIVCSANALSAFESASSPASAPASEPNKEPSTEPNAEQLSSAAFEEIGKTTWFDPASGSVVPVPMADVDPDTIHRHSRWLPEAKKLKQAAPAGSAPSSPGWFNTGVTTGNLIGWAILVILFIAVAAAVLYGFSKITPDAMSDPERARRGKDGSPDEQTLKRIEELPAELRRTDVDLRSETQRLMDLGQYDAAIMCLFGHQLLLLDRRGYLRLSRGKTNGRYVLETRRESPEAAILLRATADAFEASYFGRHTPTHDAFDELWQNNARLEKLFSRETEIAA